ncbi:hypothetical protein L228DRAFT_242816 [Xylona heveae TC161]|uniref:Uncharacterized protein n=1 Tax=Xylona heveae (strain CBS 132557 / TC161) TaxID=1328760 RepID=A0A165JKN3_XYLHT|nr:hypothetical protein L228DRAFT_242816 [Xylona heveae TC161]KZF26355.1 hypothetical protein L228DRAFT_242816 [Xylona heveae TC161]
MPALHDPITPLQKFLVACLVPASSLFFAVVLLAQLHVAHVRQVRAFIFIGGLSTFLLDTWERALILFLILGWTKSPTSFSPRINRLSTCTIPCGPYQLALGCFTLREDRLDVSETGMIGQRKLKHVAGKAVTFESYVGRVMRHHPTSLLRVPIPLSGLPGMAVGTMMFCSNDLVHPHG